MLSVFPKQFKIFLLLLAISASTAFGSDTKPATGADDWRNPSRNTIRVRDVVKVKVEGIHLEVKENKISRVEGIKTIPSYGLKVKQVLDKKGKEMPEWRGTSVIYLDNKKAKDLIAKHQDGHDLVIKGKLDVKLKLLEVESVELNPTVATKDSEKETSSGNRE